MSKGTMAFGFRCGKGLTRHIISTPKENFFELCSTCRMKLYAVKTLPRESENVFYL
jgi:hypothetical protein